MRAGIVYTSMLLLAGMLISAGPVLAERLDTSSFEETQDGTIIIDGVAFDSWETYFGSDLFRERGKCGTDFGVVVEFADGGLRGTSADCAYSNTNPAAEYDPSVVKYLIPVVVHVIQNTSGTGFISEAMVQSQIDVLNEDFLAILGSLGENGTDIQVEFYLATTDPGGNPTNGITYSTNTTWYNDGGGYYNTLAWDPNNYLNIYTNSAQGFLGYVPFLPQAGSVGSNADRVVCNWAAFGRNSPMPPYHLGRTATHEVGHFLGLFHTFEGGCAGGSCYTGGDRICDTNNEQTSTFGCPFGSPSSCGNTDPVHNYMDYTNDICMDNFTQEQARRIRCTLEFWRPNLAEIASSPCAASAARSVRIHTGFGDMPLDMGTTGGIEPREGGITKLEIDLDDASGFAGGVAVDCTPTAYAGTPLHKSTVGNTITIEFIPGLPDETNCTITLDCAATVCVRGLEGDANRDGSTDPVDNNQRLLRFGQTAAVAGATWDLNTDGNVDPVDSNQTLLRFGNGAPTCP